MLTQHLTRKPRAEGGRTNTMISDFTFGADCGPRYLKLELPCKLRSLNVTRCLRNRVQLSARGRSTRTKLTRCDDGPNQTAPRPLPKENLVRWLKLDELTIAVASGYSHSGPFGQLGPCYHPKSRLCERRSVPIATSTSAELRAAMSGRSTSILQPATAVLKSNVAAKLC